jgi:CBS domain-containing protein
MKAGDVMIRTVATVRGETTVLDALQLMLDKRISGLPVVDDDGAVIGVLTEGDFLRRAEIGTERQRPHWLALLLSPGRLANEYVAAHGRSVGEVMTSPAITVHEDTPLSDIVELMEHRYIRRVPVTKDGKLVGLVSRGDLLRALVAKASAANPAVARLSDAQLERRIAEEIERQPWGPAANVHISVVRGVADIQGVLTDDRERAALRVLVENVPGVNCVRDHLTTIEPMSGVVIRSP